MTKRVDRGEALAAVELPLINAAVERVMKLPLEARFRRMLDFVKGDLTRLSPAEIETLIWDLRALGLIGASPKVVTPAREGPLWSLGGQLQLAELQLAMREGLRQAINKPRGGWALPRPRRVALAATYDPEAKRHYFRRTWEGDERDGIIDGLWALLEKVGPERLRACAECGEPFFVRKRQEYCSLEHAQRMRNRRKAELKAQRLKPRRKRTA